ncbi:MAG: endonuclease domain-containing protein [Bacteroidota bacterium]
MKSSADDNYGFNKNLTPKANSLRKTMTKAEASLWKYVLRAGGVKGFTFRRQRPVLQYIADFMCKELWLIIEVDGITHSYEEVAENDIRRQQALEQAGFNVLRFTDEEVLTSIENVATNIENEVTRLSEEKGVLPRARNRKGS